MLNNLLILLAVLAIYALSLLAKPEKRCPTCKGYGIKGWRRRPCRRCGGVGIRFRLGAPLVHRASARLLKARAHRAEKTSEDNPVPSRWPRPRG